MKRKRIVTFGELMLRLSPNGYGRFVQADNFEVCYGGAEANVAVSLANFGYESRYVTKLPDNELGQAAVNSLRRYGVDTSYIIRGGDRIGIYFLEKGASQRPSKVVYDRAGSSVAASEPDEYNWEQIFEGAELFHFTGITPALSQNLAKTCIIACKKAKEKGIKISCDLNYRSKLWSKEQARKVMSDICQYVDICIMNEKDMEDVFDITIDDTDIVSGKLSESGYKDAIGRLQDMFGFEAVAVTLRESLSASVNNWSGMLYKDGIFYTSKKYTINIVDRVGGGDSFSAGVICGWSERMEPKQIINFAVAASVLKHSIEGDYNMVSYDEVMKLVAGDWSGRIVR